MSAGLLLPSPPPLQPWAAAPHWMKITIPICSASAQPLSSSTPPVGLLEQQAANSLQPPQSQLSLRRCSAAHCAGRQCPWTCTLELAIMLDLLQFPPGSGLRWSVLRFHISDFASRSLAKIFIDGTSAQECFRTS